MQNSAALRVSIALGAFVLLQGQSEPKGCGAEPAVPPTKTSCSDGVQALSLAPSEAAQVLRCGASSTEAFYDGTTYEFLGIVSEEGPVLKVGPFGATDFFSISPNLDASVGQVAKATYKFKHKSSGDVELANVTVTIVDFHVNIEPVTISQQVGSTMVIELGSEAAVRAVVVGPADEAHQFSWQLDDALNGADRPTVLPQNAEMLSLRSLEEGRYTLSVDVTGPMLGGKEATADVAVIDGEAGVFLADESCTSANFAGAHFDLNCSVGGSTSHHKVCGRFEVFVTRGGDVSSATPVINERDIRSNEYGVAFCKQSGEAVTITGDMTIRRTAGAEVTESFSRTFR